MTLPKPRVREVFTLFLPFSHNTVTKIKAQPSIEKIQKIDSTMPIASTAPSDSWECAIKWYKKK